MSDLLSTRKLPLALTLILCLSYLIFLSSNALFIKLTLIPTEVFVTNTRVWTFVTSSFVEGNLFRLLIDIVLIFLVTSPQEVKYDVFDQQFGVYLLSNIISSTLWTFMWLLIRFFGSDHQSFMLESCYGCGGVIMMLAMYTRRHVGGRPVLPQVPAVTFHYLPTVILAAVTLLRLLRFKTMTADINFIYCTFFSSWTYLHFLYQVEGEDVHGSSFTFIGMFPEVTPPPIVLSFISPKALVFVKYPFSSLTSLSPSPVPSHLPS
jgi:hypothetical protein